MPVPDGRHVAVALWARLGRCPHLTVTLLAQLARMLQGALLAQMFRLKFWNHFGLGTGGASGSRHYPGRLTHGGDYRLARSLDSGLMEGMSSLELLEQSVLHTVLVARPMEGIHRSRTCQSVRLWRCTWTMDI